MEQRKHFRRFTAVNIDCVSAQYADDVDKCLMANISRGGLALESRKLYVPGDKLSVTFPSLDGQNISVGVEILHMAPGGFGTLYGARYDEPDLNKMANFNQYLLKNFNLY